jgi:hypothetical protein
MSRSTGSGIVVTSRTSRSIMPGSTPKHVATRDMRRFAVVTLPITRNRDEDHLFFPARDLAVEKDIAHELPRPARRGVGVALCRDEVRRRRERHPPIKFVVNGVAFLGCLRRRKNGDVRHTTLFLRQTLDNILRTVRSRMSWSIGLRMTGPSASCAGKSSSSYAVI